MKLRKLIALAIAGTMVLTSACTSSTPNTPADPAAPATPAESTNATPAPAAPAAPENTEPKILRVGTSGLDGKFASIMSSNIYDDWVNQMVFEVLVDNTPEGEYVDGDISKMTLSDDKLTYTFVLNDGVKFADGTPMTSADVEFTYKTIGTPEYNGPRAYAVDKLVGYEAFHSGATDVFEGIKVIDEKTISFTFPDGLASPANVECFIYGILPKHYYEYNTWEDFLAKLETPLGSNAFAVEDYEPKQYVSLVRNDNYWNPAQMPKLDGILINEIPEESLMSAIQTEQVDFAQVTMSKDNYALVDTFDNVNTEIFVGNGYTFMQFNTKRPQLEDVRVRQALMYALDRKSFIEIFYGVDRDGNALADVGMAPISPVSWAFPDAGNLNDYAYDLDKANALLDEAGWVRGADGIREKDGVRLAISWLVYTDSPWPGVLSGMAADSWKQIGVELNIELMDFVTVGARTMDAAPEDKDFDIYTMGFSLSIDPDPSGALFDADAYTEGGFNASGYRDDHVQELILKGKTEFDQSKRAEYYKEFGTLMNEAIPTVIIAYRKELWVTNKRVLNMQIGTYDYWYSHVKEIDLAQ